MGLLTAVSLILSHNYWHTVRVLFSLFYCFFNVLQLGQIMFSVFRVSNIFCFSISNLLLIPPSEIFIFYIWPLEVLFGSSLYVNICLTMLMLFFEYLNIIIIFVLKFLFANWSMSHQVYLCWLFFILVLVTFSWFSALCH